VGLKCECLGRELWVEWFGTGKDVDGERKQWPDSMRSCGSLCDKLSNGPVDRVAAIHLQASMGHGDKLP
jgi:hypothetical protein